MSSLGLALIGANSYFKADDERIQREREAERFKWEQRREDSAQQRDAADLSLLPDRVTAERSGYGLRAKQNTANAGLVDAQANNARKEVELKGAGLDAAKARQPTEARTAANNAKIAETISEFSVEDLPRAIAEKKRQGIFSDADARKLVVAKLGELIDMEEKDPIVNFLNSLKQTDPRASKIPDIVSVGIEQNPQTKETFFVAKSADEQPWFAMPVQKMKEVRDSLGKTDLKVVNAGDTLVGVKGGRATPLYTAPDSAKSLAAKEGPLQRDVNYLVTQHGMTKEQALRQLNTAKIISRKDFILKNLQNMIAMGREPTKKDEEELGAMYDRAPAAPPAHTPKPTAGSNSPAPATINPQIKSLIGIP